MLDMRRAPFTPPYKARRERLQALAALAARAGREFEMRLLLAGVLPRRPVAPRSSSVISRVLHWLGNR
jgi:hypothetical protein